MTKVMLWPDVHREDGHWLPAVTLAKSLLDAGYTVGMMGIPDCAPVVQPYKVPFTEVLAEFFPMGSARERLETGKTTLSHLLPVARGALDSVFVGSGKPHLLVAGYFASLEALLISRKYNVPLVTFTTFLRHPDTRPAFGAKAALLSLPGAVTAKLIGLATGNASMSIDEFVEPLKTAPEMIPMPKEFDFKDSDWKHESRVRYVEPMVNRVPLDGSVIPTPSVNYFHPLPATGKVLYGVCGSQVEVFESSARQFFVSLIEMMKGPGMSQRHLVLPLGAKLYQEFLRTYSADGSGGTKRLPTNVSLASWAPQQEILARAEAVFLHGGLATIKETIWEGLPIVVVPMVNDQFENALRIQRGDLGVMVDINRLSPDNLREALAEATSSPWIKRSTTKMKQLFVAEENRSPKRSVEVIQGIVAP